MSWVNFLDLVYPVGSYYLSNSSTTPASAFGGTWTQITDSRFLCGSSSITTGGANTHTLTVAQMPAHTHAPSTSTSWVWPISYSWDTDEVARRTHGTGGSNYCWSTSNTSYLSEITKTASTGGGSAHNNMPAYKGVYCWYRTA